MFPVGADPRRKAILRSQARNIRRSAQQHLKRQAQEQLVCCCCPLAHVHPVKEGRLLQGAASCIAFLYDYLRDTKVDGKHWTCMPFFWDLRAIHAWVAEM